jgi:four helix bundle protein
MTKFQALELSIDTVRSLRVSLTRLQSRDPDLARQTRRALTSLPLNLSEGRRRTGRDRRYHWRVALGSLDEARTALRVAEALGYVSERSLQEPLQLLDRVAAMIWRLLQ